MRDDTPPKDDDDFEPEMMDMDMEDDVLELLSDEDIDFDSIANLAPYASNDETVEEYDDESIGIFTKHTSPVFGLSLHPKLDIAASGAVDDKVHVWNTYNTQQIHCTIKHSDTVTQVKFSPDGKYLATGDMAGNIMVHKITEEPDTENNAEENAENVPKFEMIFSTYVGDIEWMFWHFGTHVLFAGSKIVGDVYMWRIPSGDCKVMAGVGCSAELGGITEDGKKLVCVYASGMMKLWDPKTCQPIYTHYHNNENDLNNPHALAVAKDAPIFAAGDSEGKIFFYTYTEYVGQVKAQGPLECLDFAPVSTGLTVCISGTLDGQIAIWDYARMHLRHIIAHPGQGGISAMTQMSDFRFAVGTVHAKIHVLDIRSQEFLATLTGHEFTIYEICYDAKSNRLFTASEDMTVRIFQPPMETPST